MIRLLPPLYELLHLGTPLFFPLFLSSSFLCFTPVTRSFTFTRSLVEFFLLPHFCFVSFSLSGAYVHGGRLPWSHWTEAALGLLPKRSGLPKQPSSAPLLMPAKGKRSAKISAGMNGCGSVDDNVFFSFD
jgi:hypothetical protein